MINKYVFIILIVSSTICFAGGGSVIGNGAGLVENNFQYAYTALITTVTECIETQKCEMSQPELKTLIEIKKVLRQNISNVKRIIFVSDLKFPGFFDTGVNEKHRIAKTGLSSDFPIWVNSDLLYAADGQPAFDFSTISSILVHEVGHQTGEESHPKLDIIGAKVKNMILKKITSHTLKIDAESKKIEITIVNQVYPFSASDIYIAWQGIGSATLTKDLIREIQCDDNNSTLAGVEIENGHFTSISQDTTKAYKIGFGVWINLSCYSNSESKIYKLTKAVESSVDEELSLVVTSVKTIGSRD